ncbi:NAD-dependent epimerase/dehydratase family protein [Kaistia sp. MMO-174]|uniref:NAD-dependent epimerase/dehydratase family protein n=1 Tax=Kaistia sp. MMO-174 TaxID=3081256 RepID=UPI0030196711
MTVFPDTRRSALVTGATGFIGAAVTAHMAAGGYTVRAGTRRSPSSAVSPEGIVPTPCDLDDLAQTRGAVADVELVVHAAYGDEAAMVAQCRTLLQAMTEANVPALVYFSSIAVYGDRTGVIDESMSATGSLGAYARAKIECEALVAAWARDPGDPRRRVLILRPGIVYGTGSRFWTDKLAERIVAGAWGNFGRAGDGPAPLVHVDDIGALVAEAGHALLAGAAIGWPSILVLTVVGPETPSWNDYFEALAQRIGAPRLPLLGGMRLGLRQLTAVAAKIGRRVGLAGSKRAALAPTRAEMAIFGRDAVYSTRAATDLGLASRIGLDEGLARTVFPQAKL